MESKVKVFTIGFIHLGSVHILLNQVGGEGRGGGLKMLMLDYGGGGSGKRV